jgi:protein-S-isoprenylcysteine O-methyltransferase Ste14
MLHKRGIQAIVFGGKDKSDLALVPIVLALVYFICANAFGFPLWNPLKSPFWATQAPGWIGIALCVIAIAGLGASLASFGDSFRVGIDTDKPDKLVTSGLFAISRNPIYVCFDIFFIGQVLVHRSLAVLIFCVLIACWIHRQILKEEAFLDTRYGKEYSDYKAKVRRYL